MMNTKGPLKLSEKILKYAKIEETTLLRATIADLQSQNAAMLEALEQVVADTKDGRQVTQASINKATEAIRKAKGD